MKKKVNQQALDLVQKEYIKQKRESLSLLSTPNINPEKLKQFKIDISKKEIILGNLKLKLDYDVTFSKLYFISIIDKKRDLDGTLISESNKLLSVIKRKWERNEKRIKFSEMMELKIYTPLITIKIDNFRLESNLINNYSISLIDDLKDIHGRWIDEAVDVKKVMKVLDDYKLTKQNLKKFKEVPLNKDLETHFKKYFAKVIYQSGNLRGIFDLEIGTLDFVIEIKMAKAVISSKHEAYGQISEYLKGFDNKKFMLLIAGEEKDKQEKNVLALKGETEKDFKCHYYFLEAK